MTFNRPASPNALADEPAEYFRSPTLSSRDQPAECFGSHQMHDDDEPAEYFRTPTLSSDQPAQNFHSSQLSDADEPAEYFRTPTLSSDHPAKYSHSSQFPNLEEEAEYLLPTNPINLETEPLFQHSYPENQMEMNDLYFPSFLSEHSSAENPQLNQLLQPLSMQTQMAQVPMELGAGSDLDDIVVGTLPPAQMEGVYSELDARLFTALTGMQIPREQIQFGVQGQRHDCPGCNCGH